MPAKAKSPRKAKVPTATKRAAAKPKPAPKIKAKAKPKAAKPKAAIGKKKSAHPVYRVMILKSLAKDSSYHGIRTVANLIKADYPVTETRCYRYTSSGLGALHEKGLVKKIKMRYAITVKGKAALEPKKKKPAKKKAPVKKKAAAKPKAKAAASKKGGKAKKAAPKKKPAARKPAKKAGAGRAAPPKKAIAKKRGGSGSAPKRSNSVFEESGPASAHVPQSEQPYVWQFLENGGVWRNYVPSASDIVENTYLGYKANRGGTDVRAVHSGDWEYQVDFLAMKQTNVQHHAHTVRKIRRVRNTAVEE